MTRWSLFLQTLSLLHHFLGLYSEVLLTLRILREQPPDVWEEWAQSKHSPMWMRSAIVEYSVSGSRWEQVRHQADLELVEEMLGEMMESGAE